ncbi:MAG: hypothetical protein DRH06_00055 [Deltaproteobacteria bacterium]|nr:MAG: hypothetical protein DRH06_00055 [Deltaproteobacteria bacterium]
MNVGIIENPDFSIRVVHPAEGFTVQDNFDRIGATGFEMDTSMLPQTRTFRNAWVVSGTSSVAVDLPKAKELAINVLIPPIEKAIAAIAVPLAEAQDDNDHPLEVALINDRKGLRVEKELKVQEILACATVAQLEALILTL